MKIKKYFNKFKRLGMKFYIGTTASLCVLLSSTNLVHADAAPTEITSQDAKTVAGHIFKANQGMAEAFGGALIGIAVVVIGIKMLMASKKQEARSEAMDSILTVIIASLLIGGFAIFAGLFYGFGQ